jgi:hypothetical protein
MKPHVPQVVVPFPRIMPRTRTLEGGFELTARIEAHVTIDLIDGRTGLVRRRLQFQNHLTNNGLAAINQRAGGSTSMATFLTTGYFGFGTGATAPADADTNLAAPLAPLDRSATTVTADVYGNTGTFGYRRVTRKWVEAQANGTLAEFGIFDASSGGTMYARQLLKDVGGSPTTITKTSTDQLNLTYEVRIYWPTVDASSSIVLGGVSYNYTIRPLTVGGWQNGYLNNYQGEINTTAYAMESNALVANTASSMAGAFAARSASNVQAYVAAAHYRDTEFVWEPGVANHASGVGGITCGYGEYWQVAFPVKIPKDATKRLRLTFRFGFTRV